MSSGFGWYVRRLRQMSPAEVAGRLRDKGRQVVWSRQRVGPGGPFEPPRGLAADRPPPTPLPAAAHRRVSPEARAAVVAAAEGILEGHWLVLGTPRPDVADPDWFLDPVTGRRAPRDVLAFSIDHRDESVTGNVKSVWELSRHHQLTVLASAFWLTGDARFAEAVDRQLRSWWTANPFLSGVHWTSGIEVAERLVSWTWIRRLLDSWSGAPELFEANPAAQCQLWWHQRFLAAFRSHGSSANNHVVAEEVGRLVAACAFPWFAETREWREDAARGLQRHLRANTFTSGLNRELATDYHRFVTELGLVAAVEAAAAGLDAGLWELLVGSLDAAAALLDVAGRPPRQGDGDEGRALVLDDPSHDPWALLLAAGAATVGPAPWWPVTTAGVLDVALGALLPAVPAAAARRPEVRPDVFADAGLVLLRTPADETAEIWCRCDGGPHGFLSIAAHAHADALSLELRHDGVEILVDPGTYCYHGEPEWRRYFRSTLAHNTLEVDDRNQSEEGGPFLWTRHTDSVVEELAVGADRSVQAWAAHHDGYRIDGQDVRHTRRVTLDRARRSLQVDDVLTGAGRHRVRLALHLGPQVRVSLTGPVARLCWDGPRGPAEAQVLLPDSLEWHTHRGEESPVLGWYSPGFGKRIPTTVLVGTGNVALRQTWTTTVVFAEGPEDEGDGTLATRGARHE